MKKFLSLASVVLVVVLLAACSFSKTRASAFKSENDLLGFSAVSTVRSLSAVSPTPVRLATSELTPTEEKPVITEIEPYLAIIESLKLDNGFKVKETESDNELYASLIEISFKDIDGTVMLYKFYFNEEKQDDEETTITGLMVVGEVEYLFEGKKEVEIEEDETETQVEIKAYIDSDNYCLLEYEFEEELDEVEKEFTYEIYQNGNLVKSLKISFEQEDNETEISLETIEGNSSRKYKFEQEDNEIEVEYEVKENGVAVSKGKAKLTVAVNDVTGKSTITYEVDDDNDGEFEDEFESNYDDDDDDEDDEEEDV